MFRWENEMKTTFDCIAGYKNEKDEVMTICTMFNNYQLFKDKGIILPKGLLLYGEPGVGKTLFAKAIANEINRNFIEISFSKSVEYSEKELLQIKFDEARRLAPSIIFIDEIDKLVPSENNLMGYVSDDSRAILTQLLTLIDGFTDLQDVMLICTTNQIGSIPSALIRTGRIDKHLFIGKPDDQSRSAIIDYYLNKIDLEQDIDKNQIILSTEGLSGSDIKTIINESAIKVLGSNCKTITTKHLVEMIEKIEGKSIVKRTNDLEDEIIAYHELGHFVVSNELKKVIKDISINGYNQSLGRVRIKHDRSCLSKEDIINEASISLAGMAAEEVFLNTTYTTNYNDIDKAYEMIEQAVHHGHFGFQYISNLTRSFSMGGHSNESKEKVTELLTIAYDRAKSIINQKANVIESLKPILLKTKLLTSAELKEHFDGDIEYDKPMIVPHPIQNPMIKNGLFESLFDDYEDKV